MTKHQLSFLSFILMWCSFGKLHAQETKKERRARYEASPQYEDGKFVNNVPTPMVFSFRDYRTMLKKGFAGPEDHMIPGKEHPMAEKWEENKQGFWWSWLGHSTLYIQLEGQKILVDPIFSERSSPFQWIGPKRFHKVPIGPENLPMPDIVIISHDHYDHLDQATIESLAEGCKHFFVPLGVGAHIEKWGVAPEKISEMDWWQQLEWEGLQIHCTPARHFSGRGLKRDGTLWASWSIIGKKKRLFYSGDTGYFNGFKQIGEALGPFDINFMQVGAYNKLWPDIHMFPEEAIMAHKDLKAKTMVPLHWGTFHLAFHSWEEPAVRLQEAQQKEDFGLFFPLLGNQNDDHNATSEVYWWEKSMAPKPNDADR